MFGGVIPRVVRDATQQALSLGSGICTLSCSFLEIYNDELIDLLRPNDAHLRIREGFNHAVTVENLTHVEVRSVEDALTHLRAGMHHVAKSATAVHGHCSSRAHCIFEVTMRIKDVT